MNTKFYFMTEFRCLLPAFLLLVLCNNIITAQPCDSSNCRPSADLSPSGIMMAHANNRGKLMLSYRYMRQYAEGALSGSSAVNDDFIYRSYLMAPAKMSMDMHMIMLMYGLTKKVTVMAMINYATNSMAMDMYATDSHNHNGTVMNMSAAMKDASKGLSDTKLYAVINTLQAPNHRFLVNVGISMPTGGINVKGRSNDMFYAGRHLPYNMQLGSGTFDALPGVTYVYSKNKIQAGTQVTAAIRMGTNYFGYSFGNELNASPWLSYRFVKWCSVSARVSGQLAGKIRGKMNDLYKELEPAADARNYGGKKLDAFGGINFYISRIVKSKISLEAGFPVYQDLNGIQLADKYSLYAGYTILF